jgi:hypothetical protein
VIQRISTGDVMGDDRGMATLKAYLKRMPAITGTIGSGHSDDGNWWVKFSIDIEHPFPWNAVQELGCVLNYLSIEEGLPTVFMPVSPAPYLNGGPRDYLSWVIESRDREFTPETCMQWLEGRLPQPVDDPTAWRQEG